MRLNLPANPDLPDSFCILPAEGAGLRSFALSGLAAKTRVLKHAGELADAVAPRLNTSCSLTSSESFFHIKHWAFTGAHGVTPSRSSALAKNPANCFRPCFPSPSAGLMQIYPEKPWFIYVVTRSICQCYYCRMRLSGAGGAGVENTRGIPRVADLWEEVAKEL